jgi:hypothetical protein
VQGLVTVPGPVQPDMWGLKLASPLEMWVR